MSARAAIAAAWVAAAAASAASAQDLGEAVRGEVTAVALRDSPARLTVRLESGVEVDANLSPRVRVTFKPGVWRFDGRPDVSDLQRGMSVQFRWDPRRVDRVLVLSAPEGARPGAGLVEPEAPSWGGVKGTSAYEAGREIAAIVVAVDVAAGRLTAQVDGREETFLGAPDDLRRLAKDDRVVLTTGEGGRIVAVRPQRP